MERQIRFILSSLLLILASPFTSKAQVVVTTGGPPTNYTTLSAAFTAINNGTHTGAITITLTANHTLTVSATLNASGSGSANYSSVNISPNTNVTVSGSFNASLIVLNGADNVNIDGLNSSGRSLTLTNYVNNPSSQSVRCIFITNGATQITLNRLTLTSSAYYGTFFIDNTQNNHTITLSNSNIGSAGTITQRVAIYAQENPFFNDCSYNVTISNNNIYDYYYPTVWSSGFYIPVGHASWNIINNKLYQTVSRTPSAALNHYGFYISTISGPMNISNNTFGYSSSSGTGNYIFNSTTSTFMVPFYITTNTTDTITLYGNKIKNVQHTSARTDVNFYGMWLNAGIFKTLYNTIGDSASNGNITLTHSAASSSADGVLSYGIVMTGTGFIRANNNVISGINYNANTNTLPLRFRAILIQNTGCDSICNNTIGSYNTSNSIRMGASVVSANHELFGIFVSTTTSDIYVRNNIVSNLACNGTSSTAGGTVCRTIGGLFQSSKFIISSNIFRNISSYSSNNGNVTASAFQLNSSSNDNIISANIFDGIVNNNTTFSTTVAGFSITGSGNASVFQNKLSGIGIQGSATNSLSIGINITNSSATQVYNNFIHFNNSLSQNIRGLSVTGGSLININYNTILIEGSNSFTGYSACLFMNFISMTVRNNIFFNRRNSSGANYSLYNNTSTFSASTIEYNLHVVPNTNSAIYHNSAARSWLNYYTVQNTNDRFSWCENSGTLSATSLFNNTSTSDLTINASNNTCWYVNGKGWPISGIQYDWEGDVGDERSQAIIDGGTDIGADEFSTSTIPPAATASGAPAAGTTTTYTFAGKPVATIAWSAASNVPASVSVWYYSGNNPPVPIPGKNTFNCYWRIEPSTTPSGMSYTPTLFFSDALLGSVPSTSDLRMAKNSGLVPNSANWFCACTATSVNTTTRTFTTTAPFTSFSIFTGTDINAPLPVELLSFTAERKPYGIQLSWLTAVEKNCDRFEVERSYDGITFEHTGLVVNAAGNSSVTRTYSSIDQNYRTDMPAIYYRLNMIDADGLSEYSNMAVANMTADGGTILVTPNPFSDEFRIRLEGIKEKAEIRIVDLHGHVIYSALTNGEQEWIVNTTTFNQGTYLLQVITSTQLTSRKLVKY